MRDERHPRWSLLGVATAPTIFVLIAACEQTPYIHTDYEQRIDVPTISVERQTQPEVRSLPPAWVLAPMRTEMRDQVGRIIYEPPPFLGRVALADTIVRPAGAQQAGAGREPAAGAASEPAEAPVADTARTPRDTARQP